MAPQYLTAQEIRKRCKAEVAKVVIHLMGKGWRFWATGTNHYRGQCPCGEKGAGTGLKVNGTPKSATQVDREECRSLPSRARLDPMNRWAFEDKCCQLVTVWHHRRTWPRGDDPCTN